MSHRRGVLSSIVVVCVLALAPAAHAAFDPAYEAKNFSKITERLRLYAPLEYQTELRTKNLTREAQVLQIVAGDPERVLEGQLCWHKSDGCAGDTRLYDWVTRGAGIALPVLFTARNGSTLSGHVWATAGGPATRPAVVLTNGSVQAPEELYWAEAQALAKAGYVVLTYDPQGQGYSDTVGEGADLFDGVPSQTGRPFYDGTEDALDFLLSTPSAPYVPRKSCTSGTSHAAKQARRVKAGTASAYDPLHGLIDTSRIGLVGHSLGAAAVSYIGQIDPRVDAIVAYDNLSAGGAANFGQGITCDSGAAPRPAAPPLTKPALGISNDYGLTPQPNLSQPDPDAKTAGSRALSKAGVDSMEVVIRGGTHFESSFIANPAFGGTLRGYDLVSWYTLAWLDRYVKGDRAADARILTDRWRADAQEAAVDPDHDGNLLSRYYRSRVQLRTAGGTEVHCEDLRLARDCPALAPDGGPAPYDVVAADRAAEASPEGPGREAAKPWTISTDPAGATGVPPAANREPVPAPAATPCADTVRPRSQVRRTTLRIGRRGIHVSGTASDRGCAGARGRVTRVLVGVARVERGGCRFLRRGGALAARRTSCARPRYQAARGARRWSFTTRVALPAGTYRVWARAVDATANVERKSRRTAYVAVRAR